MAIKVHQGDLPEGLDFGKMVAVDTETMTRTHFRWPDI